MQHGDTSKQPFSGATQAPRTEKDAQTLIINALTARGWFVLRINGGRVGRFRSYILYPWAVSKGFPDLLAFMCGRFVLIEVKASNGELSDKQIAVRDGLTRAGVPYIVARDQYEALREMELLGLFK